MCEIERLGIMGLLGLSHFPLGKDGSGSDFKHIRNAGGMCIIVMCVLDVLVFHFSTCEYRRIPSYISANGCIFRPTGERNLPKLSEQPAVQKVHQREPEMSNWREALQ